MKRISETLESTRIGNRMVPRILALCAAALMTAGSSVRASSITWNLAGNGAWDTTTANWTGDATTFTSNNSVNVTFNNSAGGTITVSPNMLPLSTTVSGNGTYAFTGGPVAAGTLTVSSPAKLNLASNGTYTGTTISGSGTVGIPLGGGANKALNYNMSAFTGTLDLSNGMAAVLPYYSPGFVSPTGGTIRIENNTTLYLGWTGFTLNTTVALYGAQDSGGYGVLRGDTATLNGTVILGTNSSIGSAGGTFTINAVIGDGGAGYGFTKVSTGTVVLTSANTYTGPTAVTGGTLQCNNSASLGVGGSLSISSGGAKVNLNYTGDHVVSALTLGGVAKVGGTYGSASSSAPVANQSAYFSGTGTVTVPGAVIPQIVSFGLPQDQAYVDQTAKTITWYQPYGTDVTHLAPTYVLNDGTCDPASGSTRNFSSPVTYTATNQNGTTPYVVTVVVLPNETTLTWNTTNGSWNTYTSNWLGGSTSMPFFSGANVVFNNNAGGQIAIDPDMLPASITVGGTGNYTFITGPIDGGTLVKSGTGSLNLSTTPANLTSVTVNNGTLFLNAADSFAPLAAAFNMPNVTVNSGGVLEAYRAHINGTLLTMNGGRYFEYNGWNDGSWNGPITLAADSYFGNSASSCYGLTLNGVISGPGGFTYDTLNNATLTLTSANTYTGPTNVVRGTLKCNNASSLGNGGSLSVGTGGTVNLNYTGDHVVSALTLGGTVMPAGTYGATNYPLYFSGTGTVTVPLIPARIVSFTAAGAVGVIDQSALTILLNVPYGTSLNTLAPTFSLTTGACANQTSGSPPSPSFDVTNPITYTIIDGDLTNNYLVTVIVAKTVIWNTLDGVWDTTTPNWTGISTTFTSDSTENVVFKNPAGGTINISSGMLPSSTTVSGSGTYAFTGGPIAAGTLNVSGPGRLNLAGLGTYTGPTISGASTVGIPLGGGANRALNYDLSAFTGTLDLSNGMVAVLPNYSPGFVSPTGGTIRIEDNTTLYLGWTGYTLNTTVALYGAHDNGESLGALRGDGATLNGAVILGTNSSIGSAAGTFTINAVIGDGGAGYGFAKVAAGTVVLASANTYAGPTVVNGGILQCNNAASLGNGGSLTIGTSAQVNLNYTGDHIVSALTIAGVTMAGGTYGSSSSPATTKDNVHFAGTGTVTFVAAPAGYSGWQASNGATGQTPDQDHDKDGVPNGIEYFIGGPNGNTTGPTPLPGVTNTAGKLSVTWTHAADYTGIYGTDYWVETSDTPTGSWTIAATDPTPDTPGTVTITGNNVTYTFPTGTKKFVRLKVSQ